MEIIEYEDKYCEPVKDLLEELQEYIASIDKEGYNIVTTMFKEEYFKKTMAEVNSCEGKIYLAVDNEEVLGLIIGLINNNEIKTYDFQAPKRGHITELVVSKKARSQKIGTKLLNAMEEYLKTVGCKAILIDVFAYNEIANNLYTNSGYFERTNELMKKI